MFGYISAAMSVSGGNCATWAKVKKPTWPALWVADDAGRGFDALGKINCDLWVKTCLILNRF
ncbi:hypothetical protein SAMN03159495_2404 [Pseudomonas sp. NFR16]|nr:hypothetical protein SAMN03159495_2404 [Pseudomonas sp. NFR16]